MNANSAIRSLRFNKAALLHLALLLAIVFSVLPLQPAQAAPRRLPDLTVTSVTAEWSGVGDTWYMRYTVRNIGPGPVGAFRITIRENYSGRTVRTFVTPGLAAGRSRSFRLTVPYCDFFHTVIADPKNTIREVREWNNSRRIDHLC